MNEIPSILQKNIFERIFDNYCVKCGAKLPAYPYYGNDGTQFVICTKCGEKHTLTEERHIVRGF
ncbi:MAG: hypothetical protein J6P09_05580 [Methanobrevibacter sp.]|nr:hypothetical protein [Methanobrevibacter sp.]